MKNLAIISIVLWVITIGVFAKFFITGSTEKSSDNRTAVLLSPSERDLVLSEMRQLLKTVNGVIVGMSENDQAKMILSAEQSGMKMAADVNPALMAKLPMEFKKLGMSVHGDFDQLALDLKKGMSQQETLKRMGAITNKCLACHQTYRFPNQ